MVFSFSTGIWDGWWQVGKTAAFLLSTTQNRTRISPRLSAKNRYHRAKALKALLNVFWVYSQERVRIVKLPFPYSLPCVSTKLWACGHGWSWNSPELVLAPIGILAAGACNGKKPRMSGETMWLWTGSRRDSEQFKSQRSCGCR